VAEAAELRRRLDTIEQRLVGIYEKKIIKYYLTIKSA